MLFLRNSPDILFLSSYAPVCLLKSLLGNVPHAARIDASGPHVQQKPETQQETLIPCPAGGLSVLKPNLGR